MPATDNGDDTTPTTDNGGSATPTPENDGNTTPVTDNGGNTTPTPDNGGSTTSTTNNGGTTAPAATATQNQATSSAATSGANAVAAAQAATANMPATDNSVVPATVQGTITTPAGTGDNQTVTAISDTAAITHAANTADERISGGNSASGGEHYRGLFDDPDRNQLQSSADESVEVAVQELGNQTTNNSGSGLF